MSAHFGRVAVLQGGTSSEREVSLMSGAGVLAALRERGVDAHAYDPAERPLLELASAGFARAFIALHGRFGEDGTVQGALEVLGVPYTGSGVMASALCLDKWRTKLIWQTAGIPTPRYAMVRPGHQPDLKKVVADLGLPLIVKPAREGSTIGLTKVQSAGDLAAAIELAARFDPMVLIEELIAGQELTVSFLAESGRVRALPCVRIEAVAGNYDYHNKYFTDTTRYHCPAGLPEALEARIAESALAAFDVLGCRGWGRADVMLRESGEFYFLEMNTSPGMTSHSLVPIAARAVGMAYPDLCVAILSEARLDG